MLLALALAAFAPISPLMPLTVDVSTPDGVHHLVPVEQGSGRLREVCGQKESGERVCAEIVVENKKAKARFGEAARSFHVVYSENDPHPGGVTSVALGCGVVAAGAAGGALIAGAIATNTANDGVVTNAGATATGLWLVSGAAVVGGGIATYFAVVEGMTPVE